MSDLQKSDKTVGAALKNVLLDSGFGFGFALTLLFAATSPVGLWASAIATGLIATIKFTQKIAPNLFDKIASRAERLMQDPPPSLRALGLSGLVMIGAGLVAKAPRLMHDPRTPLRLIGLSGLVVMGAALAMGGLPLLAAGGVGALLTQGMAPVIIPAITSLAFAIGDMGLADSLGRVGKTEEADASKKGFLSSTAKILKRPETMFAIGNLGIGLMSGGLSVLAFPFIFCSFGLAARNVLKGAPEHKSQPHMYTGAALTVFSAVAALSGNYVVAAADIISAGYLGILSAQITPGGFNQVLADIKKDITSVAGFIGLGKKKLEPAGPTIAISSQQQSISNDNGGLSAKALSPAFETAGKTAEPITSHKQEARVENRSRINKQG